ncbi:MAG: amidophosphoribosyltransferase [Rhodopirellula sp.]|nr:amidophosphoribosyltransferase [Rhodopirellula sp.]
MAELFHECGVAAIYYLGDGVPSRFSPEQGGEQASRLIPRILLDIQNRGQLSAGMTTFCAGRKQLIDTHKEVGSVNEVFHMAHHDKYDELMSEYAGPAAIGHVRYATCGKEDRSYAQPFERHHIEKTKWFSFGFNGQLSNYQDLRAEILSDDFFHLARETDTEILMHILSQELRQEIESSGQTNLITVLERLSQRLDGAWNIVFLNALGDMFVARDPLGIKPMCYAIEDNMFAAASESVALSNMGFSDAAIQSLEPGHAIIIEKGELRIEKFAESPRKAHCFFEWIYFANVASTLDDRGVYLTRKALGEELAAQEKLSGITIDEDTIVVPVPDTAKAAADSMAYKLGVPSLEGLIRNRYIGRTFIEGRNRDEKVRAKYTPLREVLEGKKVILVEDTIVRSTTMKALISQLRERGKVRELHVRVACPPIVAPCFYGIDMSTINELFAPKFLNGGPMTPEVEAEMAETLGADSLKYLPREAISRCVDLPVSSLCQACLDTKYPTPCGQKLYSLALDASLSGDDTGRTYDTPLATTRT